MILCSTNVVMNYTEIEAKVRAATNDEAWGPTGIYSFSQNNIISNNKFVFFVIYDFC